MLSIIICTLNEEQYLPKLLNSILSQQGVLYEVIIVDAGSTDNTEGLVHQFAERTNISIRFVPSTRGVAHQRNHGAALARYQNLVFFDADVILPIDFLSNAMQQITTEHIEVAGTKIYATESNFGYRAMYWLYSNCYLPIVRLKSPVLHGCSIFSTKEMHHKIGGFRSGITFEDYRYGADAAVFSRPPLLRDLYVLTSARRFYNAPFRMTFELVRGAIFTFFTSGIPDRYFKTYHSADGKHIAPRY